MKLRKKQKNAMNDTVDSENAHQGDYLVLGEHGSGKTVLFSMLVRQLQDETNRSHGREEFHFLPSQSSGRIERTAEYVEACYNKLCRQEWPGKTEDYDEGYSFEWIWHKWLKKHCVRFYYHDYPGEAYEAAFGSREHVAPRMEQIGAYIRSSIKSASGVMLVLDSVELFNGTKVRDVGLSMKNLFRMIREENPELRLALVFTKLEVFEDYSENMEELFRKRYADAFSWLPKNYNFFPVWPLGSIDYNKAGVGIPPKKMTPKLLLEPIRWLVEGAVMAAYWRRTFNAWLRTCKVALAYVGIALIISIGGCKLINILVELKVSCGRCDGTGLIKCDKCNGTGVVFSWWGIIRDKCPTCNGERKISCDRCKREGKIKWMD